MTDQAKLMEEVEQMLSLGHDYVEVVATDFSGNLFGKRYPAHHLVEFAKYGLSLPRANFVLTKVAGDISEHTGMGYEDGDPDIAMGLVPGGMGVIGWGDRPRIQALITSTAEEDIPDPRRILKRVLNKFESLNLKPVVAFELEFTVFDAERTADGGLKDVVNPLTKASDRQGMLSVDRIDGFEDFVHEILENCASQGIDTSAICSEFAPGQFEINFTHYDDPLKAADLAQLYKRTVQAVGRKHGLIATFMAKPTLGQAGNGQHMHVSLVDETGKNIFDGGNQPTETLMHAIGGLQIGAKEAMLYWAPSVNSYRRFAHASCVPTGPTWAFDHRHVAFRIPPATGNAWRIENRIAGADANCYLTMAATLASMLVGIEEKIAPSEETKGAPDMDYDSLPLTIHDAIEATRSGNVIKPILGADFTKLYVSHRVGELEAFDHWISPRELDWYL